MELVVLNALRLPESDVVSKCEYTSSSQLAPRGCTGIQGHVDNALVHNVRNSVRRKRYVMYRVQYDVPGPENSVAVVWHEPPTLALATFVFVVAGGGDRQRGVAHRILRMKRLNSRTERGT
jgi:hypothetical protein